MRRPDSNGGETHESRQSTTNSHAPPSRATTITFSIHAKSTVLQWKTSARSRRSERTFRRHTPDTPPTLAWSRGQSIRTPRLTRLLQRHLYPLGCQDTAVCQGAGWQCRGQGAQSPHTVPRCTTGASERTADRAQLTRGHDRLNSPRTTLSLRSGSMR